MATGTESTVVAVFRNASDAQAAANELKASGFSQNDIYVSSSDVDETAFAREGETATHHEAGISGWFKRVFGGAEDDADRLRYKEAVQSGNTVLSIDVADQDLNSVADILDHYSPIDVHREFNDTGVTATGTSAPAAAAQTTTRSGAASTRAPIDEQRAIPVVQEELRVGKRAVLRGGVRVYSRVVEQPVQEDIRLREERVRVDRQRVDRPVSEADLRAGADQVIEVKEYVEEPVVSKQARVVEEVRVGKEATERTEQIRDTVRRTEVEVEGLNEANAATTGGADDLTADFRRNFTNSYGTSGETYETYAPAYQYGYEMASDPRYRGRGFNEIESDLRTDYARRYPSSSWEKMKDAIRYGWDRVAGRTKQATTGR